MARSRQDTLGLTPLLPWVIVLNREESKEIHPSLGFAPWGICLQFARHTSKSVHARAIYHTISGVHIDTNQYSPAYGNANTAPGGSGGIG
jgi:hypothetical protein